MMRSFLCIAAVWLTLLLSERSSADYAVDLKLCPVGRANRVRVFVQLFGDASGREASGVKRVHVNNWHYKGTVAADVGHVRAVRVWRQDATGRERQLCVVSAAVDGRTVWRYVNESSRVRVKRQQTTDDITGAATTIVPPGITSSEAQMPVTKPGGLSTVSLVFIISAAVVIPLFCCLSYFCTRALSRKRGASHDPIPSKRIGTGMDTRSENDTLFGVSSIGSFDNANQAAPAPQLDSIAAVDASTAQTAATEKGK